MAHFKIELNGKSIEFKKTDSGMVEQDLFSIRQMPELDAVKFYIKGKPVTLEAMHDEIDAIRQAWRDKKEKTHKQISVIDGVTGFRRKKVWVRK